MQDKKDFNSTNGSKGKTQELIRKKNPAGGMDVMFVLCLLYKDSSMKHSDMKDGRI
jgi:hypothetical protein